MPEEPEATHAGVVELTVQPMSRLWTAIFVGLGAGILAAACLLVLGEVFASMKLPAMEALILMRLK